LHANRKSRITFDRQEIDAKFLERRKPINQKEPNIYVKEKLSSFLHSCIGDVIDDRCETAKIRCGIRGLFFLEPCYNLWPVCQTSHDFAPYSIVINVIKQ
jgi:hypothetical protein